MNIQFYNTILMSVILAFASTLHNDIACSGSDGLDEQKNGRATPGYRPPIELLKKSIAETEYRPYTQPVGQLKYDSVRKMFYYGEPLPTEGEEVDVDSLALETSGSEEEVNYDPVRKQYYAGPPLPITRKSDIPNAD